MIKAKTLATAGLSVLMFGIAGYLARPTSCDFAVRGDLEPGVWLSNLAARLSGGEAACDPWEWVKARRPDKPIAIQFSINAYAGPSTHEYYIQPDGRGYSRAIDLAEEGPVRSPAETLAMIAEGRGPAHSYAFEDKALYRRVGDLIAPLAGFSHCPDGAFAPYCRAAAEFIIECPDNGYHSSYLVDWDGDPRDLPGGDNRFSHFEAGPRMDNDCAARDAAMRRLDKAVEAMQMKTPQQQNDPRPQGAARERRLPQ